MTARLCHETRAAGSEASLIRLRVRQRGRRNAVPVRPAIHRGQHGDVATDGVADHYPAARVPEVHAVVEPGGVGVRELPRPVRAGVGRLVDARLVPVANAEEIRRVRVNSMYVAKLQGVGAGDAPRLPRRATIRGAQIRALRSADPDDALVDGAHG